MQRHPGLRKHAFTRLEASPCAAMYRIASSFPDQSGCSSNTSSMSVSANDRPARYPPRTGVGSACGCPGGMSTAAIGHFCEQPGGGRHGRSFQRSCPAEWPGLGPFVCFCVRLLCFSITLDGCFLRQLEILTHSRAERELKMGCAEAQLACLTFRERPMAFRWEPGGVCGLQWRPKCWDPGYRPHTRPYFEVSSNGVSV